MKYAVVWKNEELGHFPDLYLAIGFVTAFLSKIKHIPHRHYDDLTPRELGEMIINIETGRTVWEEEKGRPPRIDEVMPEGPHEP